MVDESIHGSVDRNLSLVDGPEGSGTSSQDGLDRVPRGNPARLSRGGIASGFPAYSSQNRRHAQRSDHTGHSPRGLAYGYESGDNPDAGQSDAWRILDR